MDERKWWWMLEEMEAGADASSEKGKGCAVDEGNTSEGSTYIHTYMNVYTFMYCNDPATTTCTRTETLLLYMYTCTHVYIILLKAFFIIYYKNYNLLLIDNLLITY